MTIANHLTLADLTKMPAAELAATSADQLALLQEDVELALTTAKAAKERLDDALALKYAERAQAARRAQGKDTGITRIQDGPVLVIADLPKRVDWEQSKLAAIAERIRGSGEDPAEYLDITMKVPERKYAAWPAHLREAFIAARTLRPGKPAFRLQLREEDAR